MPALGSKCARYFQQRRTTRVRAQQSLQVELLEPRYCLTVPAFSSLPGADHTIFLDFDGQVVQNTSWNSYYNQATLNAPAYDIDGNPASFSATELARIEETWLRTAEDFRPFNVNVTTVDPGSAALSKSGAGDAEWGVRVIVTNEANMVDDPARYCGCGGIAYIDSFNWSSDTPVWVYNTGGKSIPEAASHEVGHSLGLSHDGLNSGASYYSGHGSGETGWASLMGVGYYQNVTQWDRGEYFDSNNAGSGANYGKGPDDLAVIVGGNGFGYRADDHGNDQASASALDVNGTAVSGSGIIETTTDVDVFSFATGTGLVTLNVAPFNPGPNLDIKADLFDGLGNLVATSNSTSTLSASFSLNLDAGQYYLQIDGTGWGNPGVNPPSGYSDYASLGEYFISGTVVDSPTLPQLSIADASAAEDAGTISFTLSLSQAAGAATSVTWATVSGSATAGSDFVSAGGSVVFAPGETQQTVTVTLLDDQSYEGDESFTVLLSNPSGLIISDGQAVGTILENDAEPAPTIAISDASVNEGKLNTKGRNAGTPQLTDLVLTVSLSRASAETVTVNYATADDSASAGSDYQAASGTVAFAAGQTTQTITVTVIGDNTQEQDESFLVNLTSASANAIIADGVGVGTILDDDSSGGGGKGGGKPKNSLSEVEPILVADPIWYFQDLDEGQAGHDHSAGQGGERPVDDRTAWAGLAAREKDGDANQEPQDTVDDQELWELLARAVARVRVVENEQPLAEVPSHNQRGVTAGAVDGNAEDEGQATGVESEAVGLGEETAEV